MRPQKTIRVGDYTTAADVIPKGADMHLRGADGLTGLMTAAVPQRQIGVVTRFSRQSRASAR